MRMTPRGVGDGMVMDHTIPPFRAHGFKRGDTQPLVRVRAVLSATVLLLVDVAKSSRFGLA